MDDHRHHQPYDIQDFCHLISTSRPSPNPGLFPPLASTPDTQRDLFPGHHHHPNYFNHHFPSSIQGLVSDPDHLPAPCVVGGAPHENPTVVTPANAVPWTGDGGACGGSGGTSRGDVKTECEGGGGSMGRWPRQETLTLLEIRSKLDSRFKLANHKGPLWDEVSRIMLDEHGYQRSGKKCREKFENLFKYYKKTKEGKAGRQDGKHYRFFRQLEALYGDSASNQIVSSSLIVSNNARPLCLFHRPEIITMRKNDIVGLSNSTTDAPNEESGHCLPESTDVMDRSLEGHGDDGYDKKVGKKGKGKRSWKEKIKEIVDSRVRKLMEKQEEWLRRMTRALEEKEKERVIREEEWRRQDAERFEREQEFWEKERAWIEARNAAFMDAVRRFSMGDCEIEKWKNCQDDKETVAKKKRKEIESRQGFSYGNDAVAERRCEIERTSTVHGAAAVSWNAPHLHGIITSNGGSSSSPCDSESENDGDNSRNGACHQDLNCLRYLIGDPGVGDDDLCNNYELKLIK